MAIEVDLDDPYITFEPVHASHFGVCSATLRQKFDFIGLTIQPYSPAEGRFVFARTSIQPGSYKECQGHCDHSAVLN